ncbi:MAG: ATP-binding protein [Bacillota bacterium]|nr:ATP-binding protein [Bacillota bacterium]
MNTQRIVKALSDNAAFSFEFDLTTGIVEADIIGSNGINYTQKAGLVSPCKFNELSGFYFDGEIKCRMFLNSDIKMLSAEILMDDYLSGRTRREINLLYPVTNSYYRVLHFIYEDDESGHIRVFVVGRAITEVENEVFTASGEKKDRPFEEREIFYKDLMDIQSCGVFAYSFPGYQIVAANAETLRIFECETIEDIRKNIADVIGRISYPKPEYLEKLKRLRTEDSSVDYECIINEGKANESYLIAKTKIIYSPNGRRTVYTTYVDATEMHALMDYVKKAEEGVRAKSQFLFNLSHDLRTPMNAILGYSELLQMNFSGDDKTKKYLSRLMDSSRFLLFFLNNAIELSSLDKGTEVLQNSLCNAERFIDMIGAVVQGNAIERKINYTKSINIEHNYIMCDSMKLRVIYLNLISNSLKYTPAGGSLHIDLEEIPSEKEGYASFKTVISDTGIGISPEFLPYAFESFSREKNTTSSGIFGAGLGLPVAKKLVELMGGSISVESAPDKGTTVTVIHSHRIVGEKELMELGERQAGADGKFLRDRRVLMAEDNDLNAEIAILLLSDAGLVCERVSDGMKAVEAVEEKPEDYYDIILMDIQMPVMDGYEAAQRIRKLEGRRSQIPIVAFTANSMEEDRKKAYASGMNGHVGKPINVSELMETMIEIFQ